MSAQSNRTGIRTRFAVFAAVLAGFVATGVAVALTVQARQTVARGNLQTPARNCWETAIAVGPDQVIAMFITGPGMDNDVACSIATLTPDPNDPNDPNKAEWQWTEKGFVDYPADPGLEDSVDPSIVHVPDPNAAGIFMAAALAQEPPPSGKTHVVVARYPDPNDPNAFTPWKSIAERDASLIMDKPWLVRGESGASTGKGQEYYVVWWDQPDAQSSYGYAYRRSIDGGQTWHGDVIKVGQNRITGIFCAQPAIIPGEPNDPNADRYPLYVAYKTPEDAIKFLKGVDTTDPNDPNIALVQFSKLTGPSGLGGRGPIWMPLTDLRITLNCGDVRPYVPNNWSVIHTVPQLAADPTDPGRLFLVYHDVADPNEIGDPNDPNDDPNDVDVDVFLRTLTHRSGNQWAASAPIRVNQDTKDPNYPADQCIPAVTVDDDGHVHVTFYDDRRYPDQVDDTSSDVRYDVYYTVSTNHGVTWGSESRLHALDPNDPNDPEALDDDASRDGPREYTGIAYDPYRDWIWTSFTGTDPNESDNFKDVIYSNRIDQSGE